MAVAISINKETLGGRADDRIFHRGQQRRVGFPDLPTSILQAPKVRQRLIDAGWSGSNDLESFQLSNHVREIVSDYLADRTVSLPEFRNRVVKFAPALEGLLKKFPDDETSVVDSAIIEAINHEAR